MTTLKASPAARHALDRRRLESRFLAVQSRASALPHLNLGGLLAGAENKLNLLMFDACADILDDIDSRIERHMEALKEADMAAAGQAQDQLLAERGVETASVGSVRTRDGWMFLKSRTPPRLTPEQITAGDRYAGIYRAAQRDTLRVSGANDNGDGTGPNPVDLLSTALKDLRHVQGHISSATGSSDLVVLLDAVCGRGETVRDRCDGDKVKTAVQEAHLRVALDMAAVAMRSLPSEEEQRALREPRAPQPKPVTWFRGAEFG